jgi:hypothetical protein
VSESEQVRTGLIEDFHSGSLLLEITMTSRGDSATVAFSDESIAADLRDALNRALPPERSAEMFVREVDRRANEACDRECASHIYEAYIEVAEEWGVLNRSPEVVIWVAEDDRNV